MIFNPESLLSIRLGRVILAAGLLLFLQSMALTAAESLTSDEPNRMSLLDEDRLIGIGNRLTYTVEEDRERPLTLRVNPRGRLKFLCLARFKPRGRPACSWLTRSNLCSKWIFITGRRSWWISLNLPIILAKLLCWGKSSIPALCRYRLTIS